MRGLGKAAVLTVVAALAAAASPVESDAAGVTSSAVTTTRWRVVRTLQDPSITESSGLARSAYSQVRLWTHNDSGGGSTIYAVGRRGHTVARFRLGSGTYRDWEAMARASHGGRSYLYLGDIGDNSRTRATIEVLRVHEPRLGVTGRTLRTTVYRFRYPRGRSHDAETLLVRPGTLRIFIATKQQHAHIYAAPRHPSLTEVNGLRSVAKAPAYLTDGVYLDRKRLVLRANSTGYLYRHLGGRARAFAMPHKGESVTQGSTRRTVLVGSEGLDSNIWQVRLP